MLADRVTAEPAPWLFRLRHPPLRRPTPRRGRVDDPSTFDAFAAAPRPAYSSAGTFGAVRTQGNPADPGRHSTSFQYGRRYDVASIRSTVQIRLPLRRRGAAPGRWPYSGRRRMKLYALVPPRWHSSWLRPSAGAACASRRLVSMVLPFYSRWNGDRRKSTDEPAGIARHAPPPDRLAFVTVLAPTASVWIVRPGRHGAPITDLRGWATKLRSCALDLCLARAGGDETEDSDTKTLHRSPTHAAW